MPHFLLILIGVNATVILYEDVSRRLISLWLIVAFTALNIWKYLIYATWAQLAQNLLLCIAYLLCCYLTAIVYFFLREKRFNKIMDSKIGWGDALLALGIGCAIEPLHLIPFFTMVLLLSLLLQLLFFRNSKTMPLAGFMAAGYTIFLVIKMYWL